MAQATAAHPRAGRAPAAALLPGAGSRGGVRGGQPDGRPVQPPPAVPVRGEVPLAPEAGLRGAAPDRQRPRGAPIRAGEERGLGLAGIPRLPGQPVPERVRATRAGLARRDPLPRVAAAIGRAPARPGPPPPPPPAPP